MHHLIRRPQAPKTPNSRFYNNRGKAFIIIVTSFQISLTSWPGGGNVVVALIWWLQAWRCRSVLFSAFMKLTVHCAQGFIRGWEKMILLAILKLTETHLIIIFSFYFTSAQCWASWMLDWIFVIQGREFVLSRRKHSMVICTPRYLINLLVTILKGTIWAGSHPMCFIVKFTFIPIYFVTSEGLDNDFELVVWGSLIYNSMSSA